MKIKKYLFIYLNENNEINSFEIEIIDNKFNIINEKLINNIEKCNVIINNFDCFKTSKNDILIYFFTDKFIKIYNLLNKQIIFTKNKENFSPKITSVLLTEIDNKIYVIYLTKNIKNTKQLINIIKFKYENYNEKLIKLVENDKEKEKIPHYVNSIMETIKLLNNRILIIKCLQIFNYMI